MPQSFRTRDLFNRLNMDAKRRVPPGSMEQPSLPFSEDIEKVNQVLFHPYATEPQKRLAINRWIQKHQPCVFGRIAAAKNNMHFCIISEADLQQDDQYLADKITGSRLKWKRNALRPTPEFTLPAHGFMLVVASEKVACAKPDSHLKEFALQILKLWGCPSTPSEVGSVFWETLYLQKYPQDAYFRFTFSIDFFAAQGDGRWWSDHRCPGGVGFTANSIGHMRRYKEWYQQQENQEEWMLRIAMETIDSAADIGFGKATWLKGLSNGLPVDSKLASPLNSDEYSGKDWTRYGGLLHTDLSVRDEFFFDSEAVPEEVAGRAFHQDFAYLYDSGNPDNPRFSAGEEVDFEEVRVQVGDPSLFVETGPPQIRNNDVIEGNTDVLALLREMQEWELSASNVDANSQ